MKSSATKKSTAVTAKKRKYNEDATLLGLPRELRDNIWEFALTEPGELEINSAFIEPALLSTCRQIRKEAKPVFLLANVFAVDILDCDATFLHKFMYYVYKTKSTVKIELMVGLGGKPNWANLIRWCRAIWSGHTMAFSADEDDKDGLLQVTSAATHMALECKTCESTWKHCASLLRQLRKMAGVIDPAWLAGEDSEECLDEATFAGDGYEAAALSIRYLGCSGGKE